MKERTETTYTMTMQNVWEKYNNESKKTRQEIVTIFKVRGPQLSEIKLINEDKETRQG